ncbi:MAG: hypothetical protein AAF196_17785 [Planctomycetota bacterium]
MNANDAQSRRPAKPGSDTFESRTWARRSLAQGEVLVGVEDLERSLPSWIEDGPFDLVAIWPADRPSVAIVRGFGLDLRLDESIEVRPLSIAVDERELEAPIELNRVRFEPTPDPRTQPIDDQLPENQPELRLSRGNESFVVGRAGMEYQDLLPKRHGGRFVVSRIRVGVDGPVPDFVHRHHIRGQLLICTAGRVRVVYENQGEPIWMEAGDAFLQPSGIRHRVLESEGGLEVIELGCPAVHATEIEHEFDLPNDEVDAARRWAGQRFSYSRERDGDYVSVEGGFERHRTEVLEASDGYCDLSWWRADSDGSVGFLACDAELTLLHVVEGGVRIAGEALQEGDSIVLPPSDPLELGTAVRSSRCFVARFGPLGSAGLS